MSSPRFRMVRPGKWFWLEEYVNLSSTYWLSCPSDRRIEYGSGVFSDGRPLGSTGTFSGTKRIEVLGVGSVHVRIADGGGPCLVGIWQQQFDIEATAQAEFGSLAAAAAAGDRDAAAAGKE